MASMKCKSYIMSLLTWLLSLVFHLTSAQDMGDMGDDGGGGGGEDMSDVLDPTMLMGEDGSMDFAMTGATGGKNGIESLRNQSVVALQELGIVIGVALMMGSIFLLLVYMEKAFDALATKYNQRFGAKSAQDEESPAALVGTFKRYKN